MWHQPVASPRIHHFRETSILRHVFQLQQMKSASAGFCCNWKKRGDTHHRITRPIDKQSVDILQLSPPAVQISKPWRVRKRTFCTRTRVLARGTRQPRTYSWQSKNHVRGYVNLPWCFHVSSWRQVTKTGSESTSIDISEAEWLVPPLWQLAAEASNYLDFWHILVSGVQTRLSLVEFPYSLGILYCTACGQSTGLESLVEKD